MPTHRTSLALYFALVITLFGVAACDDAHRSRDAQTPIATSNWVRTVKHDGHLFIIYGDYHGSIIHHPDCPCLRTPEHR